MGAIISEINNTRIVIPPKIEKNYVLIVYSNNPNFTREQKKDQNQLFDSFAESNFGVSITYSWVLVKTNTRILYTLRIR